ncbi:unnamed protein product [Cylicostephanus goldi]|uniref:Receptor L-domain domain-containing protein n=1 Tax=Cylicostephanus goldi TaxID=71465 RepID=A0A3P6Q2J7_CYLGO|nr:unnamed protein product [Cylicostephanus goldi]
MEVVGWKMVETVTIHITRNKNLCFTVPELDGLLTSRFVSTIEGTVCEEISIDETVEDVCRIGKSAYLESLSGGCRTLVGNLILDQNAPSQDLWKLYNVTRIYGCLHISNTSLQNFAPLWKLVDIYTLEANNSALIVDSNPRLKSIYLNKIDRFISYLPVRVSENPSLRLSGEDCDLYQTSARSEFLKNNVDCTGHQKSAIMCGDIHWLATLVSVVLQSVMTYGM